MRLQHQEVQDAMFKSDSSADDKDRILGFDAGDNIFSQEPANESDGVESQPITPPSAPPLASSSPFDQENTAPASPPLSLPISRKYSFNVSIYNILMIFCGNHVFHMW